MIQEVEKILIAEKDIAKRVRELAKEIEKDYPEGSEIIMVCILRGASVFFADLVREIENREIRMEFMSASSYGSGTVSSGVVHIEKDVKTDVKGKNMILVEDIIDTGNTLSCLKKIFEEKGASVRICSLLDKPSRRMTGLTGNYIGFTIEDVFVVGYGLDYAERFRNLKDVCILKPEVYGGK